MARTRTLKTRSANLHVREIKYSPMATLLSQRDKLLKDHTTDLIECSDLKKMVAFHANENHEILLECNIMRESMRLQQMILESDQMEVNVARVRLDTERTVLHELLQSLDLESRRGRIAVSNVCKVNR